MEDGNPLVFAALYDTWESPEGGPVLKEPAVQILVVQCMCYLKHARIFFCTGITDKLRL